MSRARDNADLGDSFGVLGAGVTGGSGLKNMTLHSSTWYIPATYTPDANDYIIYGWAESNAQGYNRLGTAPTESSDIFTMPATGYYWVTLTLCTYQVSISSDTYAGHIQLSTDGGSSFNAVVIGSHRHITDTAAEQVRSSTIQSIVKITNTGTDFIRLYGGGLKASNTQIAGGSQDTTGANYATTTTFTKLADI